MLRIQFRIASGLLATVLWGIGVIASADPVESPAVGESAGSGAAAGENAAAPSVVGEYGPVRPHVKKARGGKGAGAKAGERKARKAVEAAAAEKAKASKPAATVRKPVSSAKKSAATAKAKPLGGIQLAKVAAAGPAVIGKKIMTECHIQSSLVTAVAASNAKIVLTNSPSGKVLTLKVVDVDAPAGGLLSGSKGITVDGRLTDAGKVKGTFIATQASMAAISSCGMLEKAIHAMAAEIGAWIDQPSMNARLGKAR